MTRITFLLLLIFSINTVSIHAQYDNTLTEEYFETEEEYKQYQEHSRKLNGICDTQFGTFKTDNVSQPFKAAFFNKYKTEYPYEAELTIKWNKKKQEYDINYSMNFANGRVIKCLYTGKIPKSTF